MDRAASRLPLSKTTKRVARTFNVSLRQVAFPWAHIRQPSRWSGNSRHQIVTSLQPHIHSGWRDTKSAASGPNAVIGDTVNGHCAKRCLVLGSLNRAQHPSAVLRRVVTSGINSVDGMLDRFALTHIGQKCFKAIPSFADANARASITRPVLMPRAIAAIPHPSPHFVCEASGLAFSMPMTKATVRISHVN